MLLSRIAALLLVLSVTFGQRLYWEANGNPVDVFAVGFVLVAGLLWVLDTLILRPVRPFGRLAPATIGPFFALFAALPLLGVVLGWYQITSLYLWMVVAVPLSVLSLGRAARLHKLRLDRVLLVMIGLHGLYGLGQTLARIGILSSTVWGPATRWDAASQAALSEAYVISGRSTGLFINANVFGLWSCGAILAGVVLMKGWMRSLAVVLGLLGVLGSQSRTAWIGLAILLFLGLIRVARSSRRVGRLFVGVVMGAPLVVVLLGSGLVEQFAESSLVARLDSGLGVLAGGVSADNNLAARVDAWELAVQFSANYPFGTFGPPQALFGSFIDNQYVSLFLQGGVILVALYVLLLLSPLVLMRRGVPLAGALGVASGIVAVASFTMLPFESTSGMVPFWAIAASALACTRGSVSGVVGTAEFDGAARLPAISRVG